jgi:hypothetical protein
MRTHRTAPVDPFDLPEWLGVDEVTWTAESSLGAPLVSGRLHSGPECEACDLLACDLAYPQPVIEDAWRSAAHQAWTLGQVLPVQYDGRLTLVLPGRAVTVEPALEAVRRLARAVGSSPDRYTVALRL